MSEYRAEAVAQAMFEMLGTIAKQQKEILARLHASSPSVPLPDDTKGEGK